MADTTNLPNPTETPSPVNPSTYSPGTIAIRQTPNQGSRGLSLRNWSLILITASIAAALSPFSNIITSFLYAQPPLEPTDYLGRAKRILETTPLIDGHNDLPYMLRIELQNKIYEAVDLQKRLLGHTDFARMREGQVGGQFWSVFVDCEDVEYVNDPTAAVRDTLEQIDVTKRMIDNYTSILEYCDNPRCARDAFKKGKIASMLGIEGGHQVGNSLGSIRQFYDLGVRYITTTHNCDNAFATSASTVAKGGPDHDLSTFGHEYVKEMNRLGMMIDLSHVSHQTMRDVLSVTQAPVIFSHSGAYAVTKHMRHVPDDVLRSVRKNGGIVMMTFINRFLNMEDPDSASIDDVLDHIFHMAQTAGWENIGIGGDYSGTPECPKGLEDVSKYPYLIAGLLERGATDEQVRGVAGENILRVWAAVNDVAVQIQKETLPNEAVWDGRVWTKGHSWLPFMFSGSRMRLHGAVKAPKPTAGDWNIKI